MLLEKERIEQLEEEFLTKSSSAFAAAYKRARASGQTVVISQEGSLYKILPDGRKKLLKRLEKPTPVKLGHKIHIR